MTWRRLVSMLSAVLAVAAMPVVSASACSCAGSESPCAAQGRATAVFVGTVLDIAPVATAPVTRSARSAPQPPSVRVRFATGEQFKGQSGPTAQVTTPMDGGACGYAFRPGETYLVFAHGPADDLQTSICTRTSSLAGAREDLELLRELAKGAIVQSRLTGVALMLVSAMDGSMFPRPIGGLPNLKVVATAVAGDRHTTTTDAEGAFRFLGLPPGRYTISGEPEPPFKPTFRFDEVVELDACAADATLFMTASAFVGTVRQADGSPAAHELPVTVAPVGQLSPQTSATQYTDASGRWSLDGVGDGRYIVGINVLEPPRASAPYPPTFYPGVRSEREADAITLLERPHTVDLVLPPPLPLRTVRGVARLASGEPADRVTVEIFDGDRPEQAVERGTTDREGRFAITAVANRRLSVRATTVRREGSLVSDRVPVPDGRDDAVVALTVYQVEPPTR